MTKTKQDWIKGWQLTSEMPVIRTGHDNARVLVGDDGRVVNGAALDVATSLGQLGDFMAAAVVDEEFAVAHFVS